MKLLVNPWNDRDGIGSLRLRNETAADRFQSPPLRVSEEAARGYLGEPPPKNLAGLIVPRGRVPFREDVVVDVRRPKWGHPRRSASESSRAANPASASPVNAGGAGSGGPARRFWRQLAHPPMRRCTPHA